MDTRFLFRKILVILEYYTKYTSHYATFNMKKRILLLPIVCFASLSLLAPLPACHKKDTTHSVSTSNYTDKPIAAM